MNSRHERERYLTIFAFTAPGAAIVWYAFHGVSTNLSQAEQAVGYVDPVTQAGIILGYVVMIAGTLILGAIAAWSAVQYVRLLLRR